MTLPEIRKQIDALDEQLMRLLNQRADLVHEIGLVKRAEGTAIYAPEREEQVLRSLIEKNRAHGGRLPEKSIRAIYREIMSASLALEKDLTIAYFGSEASGAHAAAVSKFGASVNYAPQATIGQVFDCVTGGEADYGVVPIEHAIDGAVGETLERFVESDLRICAQIASDPTRFVVIGQCAAPATGHDRTSLMLRVADEPGALPGALQPLDALGIRVRTIGSRSSRAFPAQQFWFVDVEGHATEPQLRETLTQVEKRCGALKILGTAPKSGPA